MPVPQARYSIIYIMYIKVVKWLSYHNAEDISMHPSSFLYNILDRDSNRRDKLAQLSNPSRAVAHGDLKFDQSLFCSQTSL